MKMSRISSRNAVVEHFRTLNPVSGNVNIDLQHTKPIEKNKALPMVLGLMSALGLSGLVAVSGFQVAKVVKSSQISLPKTLISLSNAISESIKRN